MKKIGTYFLLILIISCTSFEYTSNKGKRVKNGKNISLKIEDISNEEPYIKVKLNSNHSNYRGEIYNDDSNRINELLLEEYLYSVVGSEMPSSFGIEALKAQAIASRTYAINNILKPKGINFDLYDTVLSQSYKGKSSEKDNIIKAVRETRGIVLVYKGEIIDALYHSSSGYKTNSSLSYYGKDVPYLQSVEDYVFDKIWDKKIEIKDFMKDFSLKSIENIEDKETVLTVDNKTIPKRKIREKYGLKSSNFTVYKDDIYININGIGYGHGVGMSQYGANELSKLGYKYDEILKHYYTNVELKKIY